MEPTSFPHMDDLVKDIEAQRAVLLIGQNFLPGVQDDLHRLLQQKLKSKLLHFHEREGLFLFEDSEAKTTAQIEAADFYKQIAPGKDILQKIVELPFRLMISTNPDKSLVNTFAAYRQRLQFDYFSSRYKENEYKLERPSADNPLLYNLCGSVEDQQSLILDYDDLFKLFKTLLSNLVIPDKEVRLPLQAARTFIFIGFHFERWYTQLLMRYLNQNEDQFTNNSSNYVKKPPLPDEGMENFYSKQFNIQFIGADLKFLEELHGHFREKFPDKMRHLVVTLSPTAATIAQLVGKDDMATALVLLKASSEQLVADDNTQLIMTEASFNQYLKDKAEGTVSQDNLNLALAKVRKIILELSQKLQ